MDNQQNISSTFTNKSDTVLSEIMAKYKLEESSEEIIKKLNEGPAINVLLLTKFTMSFSRGEISEKEFVDSISKETNISQQIAEQVTKEIIDNIIPTLGKHSEEKKNIDVPAKIKTIKSISEIIKKPDQNSADIMTDEKLKSKKTLSPKKLERDIKPTPKPKQQSGPNKYREPIE